SFSGEVYLTLIFAALKETSAKAAMNKLGLTRPEIQAVESARQLLTQKSLASIKPNSSNAEIYQTFHNVPLVSGFAAMVLSSAFDENIAAFVKYKAQLEPIQLEV